MYGKLSDGIPTAELPALMAGLAAPSPAADDAERIARIRHFEQLKAALTAAQAREMAEFAASQTSALQGEDSGLLSQKMRAQRAEQSIAHQIGLARRCSAFQARRYLGWAKILTTELPHTLAALQAGQTTEWRAMVVARETAWLSRADRAVVDRELGPRLETLGDTRTAREAATLAYRLDPVGAAERRRRAEKDRRVGLRPAPETMTRLSALLPLVQGVAAHTALGRDADAKRAAGDPRSRPQIMADTLVERVTGQTRAEDVPVEVNLILPAEALFAEPGTPGRDEPAILSGHGPVPAQWAREFLHNGTAPVWLRRLFTAPGTGELIGMESRRRCFTPAQRKFIALRDQTCRTPWCEAPIRHTDHITPAETGGPTAVENGQGYCAACNHAKQAPGWHMTTSPTPGPHTVDITTPTGHRYRSRAPNPPGSRLPRPTSNYKSPNGSTNTSANRPPSLAE